MPIYRFLIELYAIEAAVAVIVVMANRLSAAKRQPPPWAPPGYEVRRVRKGVLVAWAVAGLMGPLVMLAGWFAVFFGLMWMGCRGGGSC